MSTMLSPNPMLSPTPVPVQGQINAPPTDDPNLAVSPVNAVGDPTPLKPFDEAIQGKLPTQGVDATYLSDEAALRAKIAQQYSAILLKLGQGGIPGQTAQDANIQLAQYQHDLQQANENVTQNAQKTGTIFSGARADAQAQADYPILQKEAGVQLQAGRDLGDLYTQAQGLISDYNTQNNQELAASAARAATAETQNPVAPPPTTIYSTENAPVLSSGLSRASLEGAQTPPPHVASAIAGVHAATLNALSGSGAAGGRQ